MANSAERLYSAVLGKVTISTANGNLDGTGAVASVLTGASNGTLIKTIIIKAQTNTGEGMIRFFLKKSTSYYLHSEIYVPPVNKSTRDISFSCIVPCSPFILENGDEICVATLKSDTFNIIIEGLNITYSSTSTYIGSSLEYTANTGLALANIANPNLDGTGVLENLLTAGPASACHGTAVNTITVKAQSTTSPGMVRLFVKDGLTSNIYLLSETVVPSSIQTNTIKTFQMPILTGTLCLAPDDQLLVSTENSEPFSFVCSAQNWTNI